MAFSDPQSVTINAIANSLPRVATGENRSTYRKDDGNVILSVDHQYSKSRTRSAIRLQQKKVAADPFVTNVNVDSSQSVTVVFDRPRVPYFTNTEAKYLADALIAYLSASSGAKVTSILGGES